jgi:hypothetical protein
VQCFRVPVTTTLHVSPRLYAGLAWATESVRACICWWKDLVRQVSHVDELSFLIVGLTDEKLRLSRSFLSPAGCKAPSCVRCQHPRNACHLPERELPMAPCLSYTISKLKFKCSLHRLSCGFPLLLPVVPSEPMCLVRFLLTLLATFDTSFLLWSF